MKLAVYQALVARLESQGTLRVGGREYAVSGLSWMDREISTSALSPGQVGWDWFALQLDDERRREIRGDHRVRKAIGEARIEDDRQPARRRA